MAFAPFDLMAAAYVRDPAHFRCARVTAWVGDDALLGWFDGGAALLVAQAEGAPVSSTASTRVLYCDDVDVRIDELFRPAPGNTTSSNCTIHDCGSIGGMHPRRA